MKGEIAELHTDPKGEVKVLVKTHVREMDFLCATAFLVMLPIEEPTVGFKDGPQPLAGQTLICGKATPEQLQTVVGCALSNLWLIAPSQLLEGIIDLGAEENLFALALIAKIKTVSES